MALQMCDSQESQLLCIPILLVSLKEINSPWSSHHLKKVTPMKRRAQKKKGQKKRGKKKKKPSA